MEHFSKTVNSYKSLTILTKLSILDVSQSREYASGDKCDWKVIFV